MQETPQERRPPWGSRQAEIPGAGVNLGPGGGLRELYPEPRGPPLQCGPSPARSESQEGREPRAGTALGSESGQSGGTRTKG